jgi:hypothetical protein
VPLNRPLTAAEKAREKKLKEDPLVESLSHLYVTCKLCKISIKLSPKSTFDPFHWNKHRERCVAKRQNPPEVAKGRKKKTSTKGTVRVGFFASVMGRPLTNSMIVRMLGV